MPTAPGTPCCSPGCPEIVNGRFCDGHRRQNKRQEAARRRREGTWGAFYSSRRWRAARRRQLAREPLCEPCKEADRVREATHVHHRVPREEAPERALDETNLESCCATCHNQQHPEKGAGA